MSDWSTPNNLIRKSRVTEWWALGVNTKPDHCFLVTPVNRYTFSKLQLFIYAVSDRDIQYYISNDYTAMILVQKPHTWHD